MLLSLLEPGAVLELSPEPSPPPLRVWGLEGHSERTLDPEGITLSDTSHTGKDSTV